MNRSDLINALKDEITVSRKDAERIVDTFFVAISEALAKDERVELRGFGSFRFRTRGARSGRNPRTGKPVQVPPKKVLYFKPSKLIKNMINQ